MAAKWILFVFLSASVSCTYQLSCNYIRYLQVPECSVYYEIFEHALLSDPNTLWTLQQMLIQENPFVNCVDFFVNIVTKCNDTFQWTHHATKSTVTWRMPGGPSLSLGNIIDMNDVVGLDISLISWIIFAVSPYTEFSDYHIIPNGNGFPYYYSSYNLTLFLNELSCSTNLSDIAGALPPFVKWIKAYAKWRGKPESWDSSDKGDISWDSCRQYVPQYSNVRLTNVLKAGYILEVVFVFALVLKLVPGYYLALSERVHYNRTIYSIYWGTAFIALLINLGLLIIRLNMSMSTVPFNGKLLSTALVVSLVVAILAVCTSGRHTGLSMSIPIKAVILCCCCCNRDTKSKVFQTFTLCNILIFVHILVTSTIPLCLLAILHPAQALLIIPSVFSAMFCFIMVAARFFYLGIGRSSWYQLLLNITLSVLFLGFVFILIALYISCLDEGLHPKGVGGFLVSLVPSLFLSTIGWYVKRRFLEPDGNSGAETDSQNEENEPSDTQNNSDIEQVVIHPSAQTVSVSSSEHTPVIQQN